MMKCIILLIILFLSFKPSFSDYQFLKLVEQWPASFCLTSKCNIIPPKNFTIHGLWPTNATRPWPINCSQIPLGPTDITNLEPRLVVSWPDLFGKDQNFWQSEWLKHGTCSQKKFNQFNYFKLALDIKDRLDILTVLANEGIFPGPTTLYKNTDVASAIKKHTGQEPELRCQIAKKTVVLKKVGLCLDPDGVTYISCPTISDTPVILCKSLFKLPS